MIEPEDKVIKELSLGAEWIGEDGSAVCVALTEEDAWKKFRELVKDCMGYFEADSIRNDYELGYGWIHMCKGDDEHHEHSEKDCWFVSYRKETPYRVWVIQVK